MRILQVSAALHEGGVERGTTEMANFILSKGAGSFVASHGGRMVADLENGVHHTTLPLHLRNPFSIIYCSFKLAKLIREQEISLVHARSRAPAWAAFWACKFTNTPFITTFHGTHKIQNFMKKLYNSSMVRGERVVAISQFIKDHVTQNYGIPPEKIDIAYRGVNFDVFDKENISKADISALKKSLNIEGKFIITLPGRLTRWKGQIQFLEALEKMTDEVSWHVLFVGGAGKKVAYEVELKEAIRAKGLEGRVTLVGSQKNIPLYYAVSDVVVSNSLEPEAFGRVAVEAGAMDRCIVATAHGGSLETVLDDKTGFLVKPYDSEGMAKILRRVMQDKALLSQISNKSYEWVKKTFTVEQMCEAEWSAYEKVLGEK